MARVRREHLLKRMLQAARTAERKSGALPAPPLRPRLFAKNDLRVEAISSRQRASEGQTLVAGRSQADLLLLGKIDALRQLRFRAFYKDADWSRTLAMHERLPGKQPRLPVAAEALRQLEGKAAFVVPRLHDHGIVRGFDYVVESLVPGRTPSGREEKREVVGALLPRMLDTYEAVGIDYAPAAELFTSGLLLRRLDTLLDEHPWSDDWAPKSAVRAFAEEALDPGWELPMSLCHGDPVFSNILLVPDRGPGLIDWEFGTRMPIAYDLGKLINGAPPIDPEHLRLVSRRLSDVATTSTAPPMLQLAIGVFRHLSSWEDRRGRAERSGRLEPFERQVRRQLGTVSTLLRTPTS